MGSDETPATQKKSGQRLLGDGNHTPSTKGMGSPEKSTPINNNETTEDFFTAREEEIPEKVPKTTADNKCPKGCVTKDCYTLIAIADTDVAAWGLFVFFLQVTGLFLIIASKCIPVLGENEDVDNPDKYYMARFINADESVLVLVTQVFATVVFVLFVDNSSSDVICSIHVAKKCYYAQDFEWKSPRCKTGIYVACALRFIQGMFACLTALLLVIASSDVIDIVLNFTAINYISDLDEHAFQMAQNGWISDSLKEWTDEISSIVESSRDVHLELSEKAMSDFSSGRRFSISLNQGQLCGGNFLDDNATDSAIGKPQDTTIETKTTTETNATIDTMFETPSKESCRLGLCIIASVFFVLVLAVFWLQISHNTWTTELLRVEFADAHLQQYSGCYEAKEEWSKDRKHDRRIVYTPWSDGTYTPTHSATFAYCREGKQWVFLQEDIDPCVLDEDEGIEIAHSPNTFSFDISTVFDTPWFSPHLNKHLEMYFFDNEDNSDNPDDLRCTLLKQDGECDEELNKYAFNWDGGDCCATTCATENCGNETSNLFGTIGYGFPSCNDNVMVDVNTTIDIFETHSVHNSSHFTFTNGKGMDDDEWKEFWSKEALSSNPDLDLVCNGKTVFAVKIDPGVENLTNLKETSKVNQDATCVLTIDTFEPVFNVKTTVISAELGTNVTTTTRNSIPSALGNLSNVEQLDFSSLTLHGTIPSNLGNLAGISSLDLRNNFLTGTIPVEIFSLRNLTYLNLGHNDLKGTIPTEIGMLTNLVALDLSDNDLTGEIPKEIGLLRELSSLNLIDNGNPGLKGTFNCDLLTDLDPSDCEQNQDQVRTTPSPTKSASPTESALPTESASPSESPILSSSPSESPTKTFSPSASLAPTPLSTHSPPPQPEVAADASPPLVMEKRNSIGMWLGLGLGLTVLIGVIWYAVLGRA